MEYEDQITDILDSGAFLLSNIKPSDWAEKNRTMTPDVSPIPGKLSYRNSPYTREIVDCLSPDHPARIIAVKKGAQIGFSTTVIEVGIGWIISQNPGNILFLVGHDELVPEAIAKVDRMIDSCGIRSLIRPNVNRAKNAKTGDTNRAKEFPNGSLVSGVPSNHKLLRNRSIQYGFIDDFEAAKQSTKQSGSTTEMIEQRFAAYVKKMKLYYISTPELKQNSNIEPVYLLGDQRKFHIPCPCCGVFISIEWSILIAGKENEPGGITWKLDDNGEIIAGSVGYICQECGGFFDDTKKDALLKQGYWKPTAKPSQEGYYSYHISSLYAPSYMYDWEYYVRKYLKACPPGQPVNQAEYKTFVNLVLGETYEEANDAPDANALQLNQRNYELGLVPERVSISDGNGKIVLITCACDLNGKLDDARLDYEVVAWSENGSTYSITHGSIGTFIPNQNTKQKESDNRERWTYEHNRPNSVWREFNELLNTIWQTDTGRKMKIFISGVDTGYCEKEAFEYIDKANTWCVGLKGDKEDKYKPLESNLPCFKIGRSRANLYILRVGQLKDELATLMRLKWTAGSDESQPSGFCNYPVSKDGKYQYKNYFSHFESEQRTVEGNSGYAVWKKKSPTAQNHLWDCRIYNMALRNIMMDVIFKEYKIKNGTWQDYVDMVAGGK